MSSQSKYILSERIATGGMAEIHIGKLVGADGFSRICAFKRILPQYASDKEFINMFKQEAMLAKQLQHKNVIQVFDFVAEGNNFMLVMEYLDGQDLRAVLGATEQARRKVPSEVACYVAAEALAGLGYAHGLSDLSGKKYGIIHRDVSPQNILVSFDGDVKITDFGVAKVKTNAQSNTKAGVLKGKFSYMSPEQAGGLEVDARSDLFSLGIVLYEMVTMLRLFKGEDLVVLNSVRECKITPPNQVPGVKIPEEFEAIIMKLLSKDVNKRYVDAKEAIKDLNKCLYTIKPNFFPGEVADFMQEIFKEKIEHSKVRMRSTLALPMETGAQAKASKRPIELEAGNKANVSRSQAMFTNKLLKSTADQKPGSSGNGANAVAQSKAVSRESKNGKVRISEKLDKTLTVPRKAQTSKPMPKKQDTSWIWIAAVSFFFLVVVFGFAIKNDHQKVSTSAKKVTYDVSMQPPVSVQIEANEKYLKQGNYIKPPFQFPISEKTKLTFYRYGFAPKSVTLSNNSVQAPKQVVAMQPLKAYALATIRSIPSGATVTIHETRDKAVAPFKFPYLVSGRAYSFVVKHPKCPLQTIRQNIPAFSKNTVQNIQLKLKNCR